MGVLALDEDKITDYLTLDYPSILSPHDSASGPHNSDAERYRFSIREKLSYLPIANVYFNTERIKTGYICDINSYRVVYNNCEEENVILKISNTGNELSRVATKLHMYENEAYFYEGL